MGETDRKSIKRIIDHNKRGKKLHIFKQACNENHTQLWKHDFKFLVAITNQV